VIEGQMTVEEVLAEIEAAPKGHIPHAHDVETFTGQYINTKNPDPATINVLDIAHALAMTCRYGGHCQDFYSVAEHSVMCSVRVERKGGSLASQIGALHHDDPEAYLGDIPRPMKKLLGRAYEELTERMEVAIVTALGLRGEEGWFHTDIVKDADNWALFVEAKHLLPSQGKHWWKGDQGAAEWDLRDTLPSRIVTPDYWRGGLPPTEARALYIARHSALMARR